MTGLLAPGLLYFIAAWLMGHRWGVYGGFAVLTVVVIRSLMTLLQGNMIATLTYLVGGGAGLVLGLRQRARHEALSKRSRRPIDSPMR